MLPHRAEAVRYAKEVSRGRSLVAVGELDDSAAGYAASILARRAVRQGSPEVAAPKGLVSGRESRIDVNRAASEIGLDAQLPLPARLVASKQPHIKVFDGPKLEKMSCECYEVVRKENERLEHYQTTKGSWA